MNRKGILALVGGCALVSGVALSNTACIVRTQPVAYARPVATVQPAPVQASVSVSAQPVLASGVTVIQQTCTPGAPEQCNGLDDNCNGAIDEGCGYSTGSVQITLAWNSPADIDLYVTDPYNQTISYQQTGVSSGGQLDHDARGACLTSSGPTVENVYWNANPPRGTYRVEIHHYSDCGGGMGPTQTVLSIAVGGQILGSYSYAIYPQQRIPVTTFSL